MPSILFLGTQSSFKTPRKAYQVEFFCLLQITLIISGEWAPHSKNRRNYIYFNLIRIPFPISEELLSLTLVLFASIVREGRMLVLVSTNH